MGRLNVFAIMVIGIVLSTAVAAQIEISGGAAVAGLNVVEIESINPAAFIFTHTNRTIPVNFTAFRNVTFDVFSDPTERNIMHTFNDTTNDTFFILSAGIYRLDFHIDIVDSAPLPTATITARFMVNGVEARGSVFTTDTTKQNVEEELANAVLIELNVDDQVNLQIRTDNPTVNIETHGMFGIEPTSAAVILTRIEDA